MTGKTPLHHVVSGGDISSVMKLLLRGADPNAADAEKKTPLHGAAAEGWHGGILELLRAGGDPNAVCHMQKSFVEAVTPLYLATKCAVESNGSDIDLKTLELMIESGADPTLRNIADGRVETVEQMCQRRRKVAIADWINLLVHRRTLAQTGAPAGDHQAKDLSL